tara:strand:+ start:191 stop:904 length:714 start_codon:yes stop_codon:yes gene_type:complete
MIYTQNQLEYIRKKRPELRPKPVPKLDDVIVEFLKKFEVDVTPITSKSKNTGGNALAGAITGMAGADVGGDAFLISGQDKQTKVQEWIQWKQWALSHKDFEAFKEEKIGKLLAFNKNIEDKLKDPEFQKELEPLIKVLNDQTISNRKKESEANSTFGLIAILIIGLFIALFGLYSQQEGKNDYPSDEEIRRTEDKSWMRKPLKSNFESKSDEEFCKSSEPSKLEGYWVRYYKMMCIN